MTVLFWICWSAELAVVLWWLFTELQLTHLSPNPVSFLGLAYLLLALFLRFQPGCKTITMVMVGLPAIPLAGMSLIVIIHYLSGQKWN